MNRKPKHRTMNTNRIFLVLFAALGLALNGWGQTVTKAGIIYTATSENTASVTGVSNRLVGTKTIESQVGISGKSCRVNAISFQAFAGQKYLRSLTLPAQLDSIGNEAFIGCSFLQELKGLTDVRHVGDYAFIGTALTEIDMSGWAVKSMGHGVFSGCTQLTQAKLPVVLKTLPPRTFSKCAALGQTNLSELTALKEIGEGAFAGCSSMTSITLPQSVITLQPFAFEGMTSLAVIELPKALAGIGDFAFRGCTALSELVLPDGLTDLGLSPFYGCNALQSVTLSARLKSISEHYVFDHCPALESISIPVQNTLYTSVEGVLYNRTKSQIIAWPAGLSRRIHPVLPASATPLARGALMDCELDEQVWLPARMNTLSYDALTRTSGMKGLAAAQGSLLATIEPRAVNYCPDLQVIDLPATVRQIGEAAFQGCSAVRDILTKSSMPPTIHYTSFSEDMFAGACLHVRTGSRSVYRMQSLWGHFANIVDDALTTDIPALPAEDGEGIVYDLSGRRIREGSALGSPLQKGVYIIRGRKVVK